MWLSIFLVIVTLGNGPTVSKCLVALSILSSTPRWYPRSKQSHIHTVPRGQRFRTRSRSAGLAAPRGIPTKLARHGDGGARYVRGRGQAKSQGSAPRISPASTHLRRLVRMGSDHSVWSCTNPVDMLTRTYLNLEEEGVRVTFV